MLASALLVIASPGCSDRKTEPPGSRSAAPAALRPEEALEVFMTSNTLFVGLVKAANEKEGSAGARRAFEDNRADLVKKWQPVRDLRGVELTMQIKQDLAENVRKAASDLCALDDLTLCTDYSALLAP